MKTPSRLVVACGSLRPELEAARTSDDDIDIVYLDQNLHRTPRRLTDALNETLAHVDPAVETVVLGYGLCSGGAAGVIAPAQGLVIPRVHDCIALFLGSRQAYQTQFAAHPGTYYLTPGWVAEKKDPLGYMETEYVPRMGRETAEWGLREELKHYRRLALINTGAGDIRSLRARARENADFLEKDLVELSGSREFFRKILYGPYDPEDFVIVGPGEKVSQKPFLAP